MILTMFLTNTSRSRRVILWLRRGAFVAAVLTCLTACGSKSLTRASASDEIRSGDAFSNPVTITLQPEYRQPLIIIGTGSRDVPREEFALRRFFESRPDLAVLSNLGLVGFKVSSIEHLDSAASPVTVTATLTDAGRSASREWQQSGGAWVIPIAQRELVEVTGLTGGESGSKEARAEYTWRWKPISIGTSFDTSSGDYQRLPESIRRSPGGASFADVLGNVGQVTFFDSSKTQNGEVTLRLYDDGWRVEEKKR